MGERPTDALWGIGRKTARRLAALGIDTVADLAATPAQELADRLGPTLGPWYRRLGRGADTSPVQGEPYVNRSRGRETTFQQDLTDPWRIEREVRRLAAQVGQDVAAEGRPALRVGLKIRFAPFETRTRSLTLPAPTADPNELGAAAVRLLERFALAERGRPVRLLGVRAEMAAPDPGERPGAGDRPQPGAGS
jgi:DNA polymerase-4